MKKKKSSEKKQPYKSVLHADQVFVKKILSRNSSVGNNSSSSFRPSVEVPFKWESRPGEPKDKQEEKTEPEPLSPPASGPHAPPVTRSKEVVDVSQGGLKHFLKKIISKGQKARMFSSSVAAARGFHSGEMARECSYEDGNKMGPCTAPVSPVCSGRSYDLRLDKPSRFQKIPKGCVKWMF